MNNDLKISGGKPAGPIRKKCKWGRCADDTPEAIAEQPGETESQSNGEMDPGLWGELYRYVEIEEMVVAKLPLHAFYKFRSVCKSWNSLAWNRPFLERYSSTSLPKPYFILFGNRGCHQAMLVRDKTLEKWTLMPLPSFGFQQPDTSVAHGIVYTGANVDNAVRGTVYNIHTKVFRRLPPLNLHPYCVSNLSRLAVDKRSGSYKVLVVWNSGECTSVYDSLTGKWSRKSTSPVPVSQLDDSTYCNGVMYIKWRVPPLLRRRVLHLFPRQLPLHFPPRQVALHLAPPRQWPLHPRHGFGRNPLLPPLPTEPRLIAYNFELDSWSVFPLVVHGAARMHGLGEWRGALRDLSLDEEEGLRVWEFQQSLQEWLEVDRMPTGMLEWFLDDNVRHCLTHNDNFALRIKTSYCERRILMAHHAFPERSGVAKFVLYDMELKSWESLNVAKDWTCSCPLKN